MVSPASLRPVGAGFTGPTAPNINNDKSRFSVLALKGGVPYGESSYNRNEVGGRVLLRWPVQGGEVFVYGTVKSLQRCRGQPLFILVANVNGGLLEGIDEGRVGSNVGHGVNKDCPHLGIGEVGSAFVGFLSRHP